MLTKLTFLKPFLVAGAVAAAMTVASTSVVDAFAASPAMTTPVATHVVFTNDPVDPGGPGGGGCDANGNCGSGGLNRGPGGGPGGQGCIPGDGCGSGGQFFGPGGLPGGGGCLPGVGCGSGHG